MQYIFWLALFLIFYSYFGYPLTLFLVKLLKGKKTYRNFPIEILPKISFIITAYNEEKNIANKLQNTIESTKHERFVFSFTGCAIKQ